MMHNNLTNNLFFNQSVTTVSTNYTVLPDDVIILVSNTSTPRQITLPAPSPDNQGKWLLIKDTSGGASSYAIKVKSASGLIDGVATKTIASNYGSLEVYSDGVQYISNTAPSLSPTSTFARGGWEKFAQAPFEPYSGNLPQIAKPNQLINSSARLDLSQLREVSNPILLQVRDKKIQFTQAGLYQIIFQAIVEKSGNPVVQLVKNDQDLLFTFVTTVDKLYKRKLNFFHTAKLEIDDYLDFRLARVWTNSKENFTFYSVACCVQQLATQSVF